MNNSVNTGESNFLQQEIKSQEMQDWKKKINQHSASRANKLEMILGGRLTFLPWSITRKGILIRLSSAYGSDAAADLVLSARLRFTAAFFVILATVCFFFHPIIVIVIGLLLEIIALTAAVASEYRLHKSGIPRRRRILNRNH